MMRIQRRDVALACNACAASDSCACRETLCVVSIGKLDVKITSPRSLRLYLVDAHFGVFILVVRDGQVVAI